MAWNDEIGEAAYTSPSGKRMTFNYDSGLERKTTLKTAENVFPDVDGAEIQSLGLGGKKFPMTAIFSGADCLKQADDFEALLCERGYGILEHPIYGKYNVVPTGEIGRNDNLVSGLNESSVKVTFSETITVKTFPESDIAATDALTAAIDGYEDAASTSFAELIATGSIDDELQLQSVLKTQSDSLFKGISNLAKKAGDKAGELQQKIQTFKTNVNKWISKVDQIAANAQNIATVLIKTARLPSEIAISALAKIEGYSSIIKDMINNVSKDPVGINAIKNQYAATSTMVGALVGAMGYGVAQTASSSSIGSVPSTSSNSMTSSSSSSGGSVGGGSSGGSSTRSDSVNTASTANVESGGFQSRAAVLNAVDLISEQFEVYKEYVDSQIEKDAFVDTGEGYSALLETIVSAGKVLETVSFDLPITRIMKLGRDRQVIELLCELYGVNGFAMLDQFIADNELTSEEIVLLPMGREVRYYG